MSLLDSQTAHEIYHGIDSGDVARVRRLLTDHPQFRTIATFLRPSWLHDAAAKGHVPMMEMLLDLGLDINKVDQPAQTSPLISAIDKGRVDAVQYLLKKGADPNLGRPLIAAINFGRDDVALQMVKQLVERQADINRAFPFGDEDGPRFNALAWAEANEKMEIADYLRSQGAKSEQEAAAVAAGDDPSAEIVAFFTERFGPVAPLSQQEIVPSGMPIAIHAIRPTAQRNVLTLFTTGMSDAPLNVSSDQEMYRYAELMIHLPSRGPSSRGAMRDANQRWCFELLRTIAQDAHDQATWPGGPIIIIDHGDPPKPLATDVTFTAILLAAKEEIHCRDGRLIQVYALVPLYSEERDLEMRHGISALMQALDGRGITDVVDPSRPNAGITRGEKWTPKTGQVVKREKDAFGG